MRRDVQTQLCTRVCGLLVLPVLQLLPDRLSRHQRHRLRLLHVPAQHRVAGDLRDRRGTLGGQEKLVAVDFVPGFPERRNVANPYVSSNDIASSMASYAP